MTATAADICQALEKRFASPAYAVFYEVSNATGAQLRRYADAVAFGLWPSRGYTIEGIEIKVNRSDWIKEIKDPTKAASIQRYCNRWWIATPPNVIDPGEVPANWGHLVLTRGVLRAQKKAPDLDPEPMSPGFVASVMRRCHERQQAIRGEGFEEGRRSVESRQIEETPEYRRLKLAYEHIQREHERYRDQVRQFEEKSGLLVSQWFHGDRIKKALQLLNGSGIKLEKLKQTIDGLVETHAIETQRIKEALREVQE